MTYLKLYKNQLSTLLFILLLTVTFSCKTDTKERTNQSDEVSSSIPENMQSPAAGDVAHYTCPNGHPGAAAKGTCSVCGTELVHNQAFHANQNSTPPATNPSMTNPNQVIEEPAVNANGIYHYTCPAGHAGGAGSASPCSVCGQTLVHNTAYHN